MAKYKLQELPDFNNDGKRKVYPKMVVNNSSCRLLDILEQCQEGVGNRGTRHPARGVDRSE